MISRCNQCRAELKPSDTQCASCGKLFDAPVPPPKLDSATDDGILSRSASHRTTESPSMFAEPPPNSGTPMQSARQQRRNRTWLWITAGVIVIGVIAALFRGGYTVLMKSPLGGVAYDTHARAAQADFDRGDLKGAYSEYSAMIAIRPKNYSAYSMRAEVDTKAEWWQKNVDDETMAINLTLDPEVLGDSYYYRGDSYGKLSKWSSAARDYIQANLHYAQLTNAIAVINKPAYMDHVRRSLANAYYMQNEYEPAIAICNADIATGDGEAKDFGTRALCELALNKTDAAISDFGVALKLDPSYSPATDNLNSIADKTHEYARIALVYLSASEANPYDAPLLGSLGWAEYRAGDVPAAIESNKHALALDQSQGWVIYNLALCYAVTGEATTSKSLYDVALTTTPSQSVDAMPDVLKAAIAHPNNHALVAAAAQLSSGKASPGIHNLPLDITESYTPPAPKPEDFKLAASVQQIGYAIRPPVHFHVYRDIVTHYSDFTITDKFYGIVRYDDTYPLLRIRHYFDDGTDSSKYNNASSMHRRLTYVAKSYTAFQSSPPTAVSFGKCGFVTSNYSGTARTNGTKFSGTETICERHGEYIEITTIDGTRYARQTLPLLNAAVHTFIREPGGDYPQPKCGCIVGEN